MDFDFDVLPQTPETDSKHMPIRPKSEPGITNVTHSVDTIPIDEYSALPLIQPPHTPAADFAKLSTQRKNGPNGGEVAVPKHVPGSLISIEEWDALFPVRFPEQAAKQAAQRLAATGKPVPLSPKSNNPEAVAKFNHLCQVHSLTPSYTFKELTKGLFSSKLTFGDWVYEEAGPFTSKKLAKEAVAVRGIQLLEELGPSLLKNKNLESTRRKLPSSGDPNDSPNDFNGGWVAILHEFTQRNHQPKPVFQLFEIDTRSKQQRGLCNSPSQYGCTLTLQARPDYTFGSATTPHVKQAEAKRSAAKDAVLWLRTVGMLPTTPAASTTTPPPSTKRRKSSTAEGSGPPTEPTQEPSPSIPKTEQSPAQLVVELSLRLGLSQPQFMCEPAGQNFYICTAHYTDRDVQRQAQLAGPLCATPSVFGQKNAKRMCAGELVGVLEGIVAEVGVGR